jgi:aspartate-semialdehyde dehydrogenase
MLRTLERRSFQANRVVALASERSRGQKLDYRGTKLTVEKLEPTSFKGVDIALFSAGAATAREFGPIAAESGAVVIDNSSAWRMDPDVPLVVPEVNPGALSERKKGIIANPNCSTIQMVVALKPLHDAARIKHIVVSTYQATSGKGHAAVEELRAQIRDIAAGKLPTPQVFPGPIALNVLSDWKPGRDGYSEEELKMVNETKKIMGDPSIGVTPTCVRVPVVSGHSESVHVQFHEPLSAARAKDLLRAAPGVELVDGEYRPGGEPQPLRAADTDPVYVGRVRDDLAIPGSLNLWIVADNLRKGAALNAVQIAELLTR